MIYLIAIVVIYLYVFGKKDREKIKRTRQKTVRILRYITRIIQTSDKKDEREDK